VKRESSREKIFSFRRRRGGGGGKNEERRKKAPKTSTL